MTVGTLGNGLTRNVPRNVPVRQPVRLEWLLDWAYVRQRVRMACNVVPNGPGLAQSDWNGALGTTVQASAWYGDTVPADALLLHRLVGAIEPALARSYVIHYAEVGHRPDPMIGILPWPMPKPRDRRGRQNNRCMIRTESGRQYCPVHFVPTWDEIASSREVYAHWHAGMRFLSDALLAGSPVLAGFALSRPFAEPAEPWRVQVAGPRRHPRARPESWLLPKKTA